MHMTMRWASQGKDSLEWENQVNHPIMKVCEEHGTVLGVSGGFGGKKPQARLMCRVTKRKRAVDRWRAETSLVGRGKCVAQGSEAGGWVSSNGVVDRFLFK